MEELRLKDTTAYREMLRMSHESFLENLGIIEKDRPLPNIWWQYDNKLKTLRFLATGEKIFVPCLSSFNFESGNILKEVYHAIIVNMRSLYFMLPSNAEEWLKIAKVFDKKVQFPNCLGAMDGKHLLMQPPANAGSRFYNYKHSHSVVLLAIAGPNYECI